jgi:hypothetical protein
MGELRPKLEKLAMRLFTFNTGPGVNSAPTVGIAGRNGLEPKAARGPSYFRVHTAEGHQQL